MSFASDVKNELARIEPEKKCCMLAEISGFIRVAGSCGIGLGGFKLTISTSNAAVARHYKKLLSEYFGIETKLEVAEAPQVGSSVSRKIYSILIDANNRAEQILRETGILMIREGNNYFTDGIYDTILKNKCCRKSYLRGMWLGCGTMSDPKKSYQLEFVTERPVLAKDLKRLIGTFVDLEAKVTTRGNKHVVYMKKGDYISDTLALMGATTSMLEFENTRIKKSMVEKTHRTVNCDAGNLGRTIDASMRQIEAITKIAESKAGIGGLPLSLQEVALLRLEHPDIGIAALGQLCVPPLTKSGVNNRLRKIEEYAEKI